MSRPTLETLERRESPSGFDASTLFTPAEQAILLGYASVEVASVSFAANASGQLVQTSSSWNTSAVPGSAAALQYIQTHSPAQVEGTLLAMAAYLHATGH